MMTKLDCSVVNCTYNENHCCSRDDIFVEGENANTPSETCCGDFKACGTGASNTTKCACKATEVKCGAKNCKYNESGKCAAGHIGIVGGHADRNRETECSTFQY